MHVPLWKSCASIAFGSKAEFLMLHIGLGHTDDLVLWHLVVPLEERGNKE